MRRCNLPSYVSTADAISKYFSDDPEWCRLSDEFHSIARDPGALGLGPNEERELEDEMRAELAKRELASRENYLFDNVYQAAVRQELQVLLTDGCRTFQLPGLYTYEMADALRSGWAAKIRLTGPDTIWNEARLVFSEENWRQWWKNHRTSSAEADVRKSAGEPTGIAQAETVPKSEAEPTGIVHESETPVAAPKERLKGYIAEIVGDRLRLRKGDFDALCRRLGFKPNEIGRTLE